ncbi:MAG: phosphogluconate dehydrogenase (NAD(+)-dependent, decarboxylating) [Pseudomonadota bacterium]
MGEETTGFGIVGLGRMGGGVAKQARSRSVRVVATTRNGVPEELLQEGVIDAGGLEGFRDHLERPRIVCVWVPAGPVVDDILDALADALEPGDIVVDGGNSYWGDSRRRHARLAEKDIRFVDVGISGGVAGAEAGACMMVGGEAEALARVRPILRPFCVEGGYVEAGPPGAGHFTKLVHNGIEFGMLQAIAEGVDLLEHYDQDLPVAEVLRCWRHGSVIRSWLVDLMEQAYREEGGLDDVPGYVEDTGEVNWLVADALQMERPTPVIAQAVQQLFVSRDEGRDGARAIAMMRKGFGGHPYGPDEHVARERREGRVGPIWRSDHRALTDR